MKQVSRLSVCRWVHILLVVIHVFVTIMHVIVALMIFRVRLPNVLRWSMLFGWFAFCFGSAFFLEHMGWLVGQGCRLPIRSEEEKMFALMDDVQRRMNSIGQTVPKTDDKRRPNPSVKAVRFAIRVDPKKDDGSFGYRTILISSGTLMMASDEELRGILAHELGHLRDGDPIWEAAFFCSGLPARAFRLACRFIRVCGRSNALGGCLLVVLLSPLLLPLLILFLTGKVFQALIRPLEAQAEYRQDSFATRIGCGKGLRDCLERSGLARNVIRIRRLEKML